MQDKATPDLNLPLTDLHSPPEIDSSHPPHGVSWQMTQEPWEVSGGVVL
jgi:hypothetical protein